MASIPAKEDARSDVQVSPESTMLTPALTGTMPTPEATMPAIPESPTSNHETSHSLGETTPASFFTPSSVDSPVPGSISDLPDLSLLDRASPSGSSQVSSSLPPPSPVFPSPWSPTGTQSFSYNFGQPTPLCPLDDFLRTYRTAIDPWQSSTLGASTSSVLTPAPGPVLQPVVTHTPASDTLAPSVTHLPAPKLMPSLPHSSNLPSPQHSVTRASNEVLPQITTIFPETLIVSDMPGLDAFHAEAPKTPPTSLTSPGNVGSTSVDVLSASMPEESTIQPSPTPLQSHQSSPSQAYPSPDDLTADAAPAGRSQHVCQASRCNEVTNSIRSESTPPKKCPAAGNWVSSTKKQKVT
ncbi:hypothetical protein BDN67DRAFT_1016521 [Paxillus ammoniavirescens]|nr:hypothetical protein BDN67DRAFT_1016521 [Paxillus ammoniavirescens]